MKSTADKDKVYLIGARYHHHSGHSGYEGFSRWIGTYLKPPVNFREAVAWKTQQWSWLPRNLIQEIDNFLISVTNCPGYSLAALLAEGSAALEMLKCSDCIFHILYGDTDLNLLGRISSITRNHLVATFHQAPSGMEILGVDERITKNLAAAIIVSESQRIHFEALLPPERVFMVPHGIDTDFFRPAPQLSDDPICITVGAHWRDFNTLEQAIHKIWEVNPKMNFIAVGTHRYKGDNLDTGLNIQDSRFKLMMNLSDEQLRQAYQQSRVAVLSLWDATANNCLLEAMSCGLPVVATDVGGVREYLGDEVGCVCPQYDAQAMAKAVLQLLDEQSLATKMGTASRERALQFDYKIVAEQMKQVYAKLLTKGSN